MADPLSITVSVLALIKVSVQVSLLVKQFCDEVSIVDATLAGVLNEVEGFQRVLESMKETFEQDDIKSNLQATGHVGTHWKNLARALQDGTTTLQQLYTLLEAINKTTSVLDKPRRQLRLKNAAEQIMVYREQIKSYRAALQLSLSTVILWNQVTFQKSTEEIPNKILPTLDKLYEEFRSFGALLNAKIEKLENTVTSQSDESDYELKKMSNLRECVRSAADVASTTSSTLTAELSDKVSVRNGSDFGDIFVKDNNEPMLRWMSSNTVYEFEDMESPFPDPSETSTGAATEYQSDSDSDIENEMMRALFNDGKKRKEKGDYPTAARLFRNCLTRLSSNASHASLTSLQSVSTCGFSKIELLELLTDTYSLMESWSEAKLTMLEKLSITERQVGTKDQRYLWDMLSLAGFLMKTNEFVEAHLQGRRSLRGFKKLGEPGYEGYETCLDFLCHLCKLEGKLDEEEAYFALLGNHQRKIQSSSSNAAPPSTMNSDTRQLPENTPIPGLLTPEIPRHVAALKKEALQLQDSSATTDQGARDLLPTSQTALPDYSKITNPDKYKSVGSSSKPPRKLSEDNEAHRNTSPSHNTPSLPGQQVVLRKKPITSPQSEKTQDLGDKPPTSAQKTIMSIPSVEFSYTQGQSSPLPVVFPSQRGDVKFYGWWFFVLPAADRQNLWKMLHHLNVPPSVTDFSHMLYRVAKEGGLKRGSNVLRTDLAFLTNYCKSFRFAPPKIVSVKQEKGWAARVTIPNNYTYRVYNFTTEEASRDAAVAKACFAHVTAADQEHVISLFEKRDPFSDKEVCEPQNNVLRQVIVRRDSAPSKRAVRVPGPLQECPICTDILPELSLEEFSSHVNNCIDEAKFQAEYLEAEKAESTTTARVTNFLDSARDDPPDSFSEVREISSLPDGSLQSTPLDGTWACDSCELDTIQFFSDKECQNCGVSRSYRCPSSLNRFAPYRGFSHQINSISLEATAFTFFGKEATERRVLLLGDTLCGKTFLASSWANGEIERGNTSMLNEFYTMEGLNDHPVRLHIRDSTGEELSAERMLQKGYHPHMHVIVLCFDISNPTSLDNIEHRWNLDAQHYLPGVPKILVGCQKDRRSSDAARASMKVDGMPLSPFAGNKMAKKIQALAYFETSAEEGDGLEELSNFIANAPSTKGKSTGIRKFWSRS